MGVPTYDQLIEPLLRALGAAPDGLSAREARSRVATDLNIAPDDLEEMLPSGMQSRFSNRVGWAHDRLKRAGLSGSPERGFWRLTPQGQEMAKSAQVDVDAIMQMGLGVRERISGEPPPSSTPPPEPGQLSPTERIEGAIEELTDSLSEELLGTIGQASPTFFEQLVLDVLRAMGYGASRASIERTGGSGDGGIDGIITLDRLGLEKVYVQAKRWQGTVGRPEIQGFFGALASRRASKGVFITTSRFTREATEFAAQASDSLVLVDGALLTRLMVEYEVGVSVERTIKLSRLDSDYFEEG